MNNIILIMKGFGIDEEKVVGSFNGRLYAVRAGAWRGVGGHYGQY